MDASDYLLAQKSSPSSLDMAKVHIQFIFIIFFQLFHCLPGKSGCLEKKLNALFHKIHNFKFYFSTRLIIIKDMLSLRIIQILNFEYKD